MQQEKHNGWSNYETWCVNVWITTDTQCYNYIKDICGNSYCVEEFADTLKTHFELISPDLGNTLYADLLNAALSEVDWYEIADSFIKENTNDKTSR